MGRFSTGCVALLLSFLCAAAMPSDAEGDSIARHAETVNRFNRVFPQEKVYLHLDNTGYFMGETIWLKAYMVRTDKDSLGSLSRVLYVELVSPSGDVVKTQKLKVVDGTACGEIQLDDLLTSGYYEVRAYTRYMLNWGKDAIFSRVIPVFDEPATAGDYRRPTINEDFGGRTMPNMREETAEKLRRINAKFYPEGGRLVRGLTGRVAFELTDRQGRGVACECLLKRGDEVLARVSTLHEGRGLFELVPDGRRATLHVTTEDGRTAVFDVPDGEAAGCVLRADVLGEDVRISLTASADMRGRTVGVAWLQGGHVYHCQEVTLGNTPASYRLARSSLREGVNQVTVIDPSGAILAHRLVFVYPHGQPLSLAISPSNTRTLVGNKEVVELSGPPDTSFSMSITDASTQTGGWQHNAATWLLLTSDLRGYIHNPAYYLESDDRDHRLAADLLMMVQGWRRYDFQTMEGKKTFVMNHSLEDRLYIDGKLNPRKRKHTVDNVQMGVVLTNELGDQLAGQTLTSAKGHYAFALPDCYRDWDMTIMTMKDDKYEKYYVGINRHFAPESRPLSPLETEPAELPEPSLVLTGDAGDDEHWRLGDVQVLQEVEVKGKLWRNPRDFWERESRGADKASLAYDCGREADALLDQGQPVPSLIDFLKQKNPLFSGNDNLSGAASYVDNSYNLHDDGLMYGRRPVVWVLNNRFFCATGVPARRVKSLPENDLPLEKPDVFPSFLDEVKHVYISTDKKVLRRVAMYLEDSLGPNYVIAYVYSYHSRPAKPTKGIRLTHFEGFNVPKEYEQEMTLGLRPEADHRRTLYWNPDVKTNSEGRAVIEFLNKPSCRLINITAEGITKDGRPMTYK